MHVLIVSQLAGCLPACIRISTSLNAFIQQWVSTRISQILRYNLMTGIKRGIGSETNQKCHLKATKDGEKKPQISRNKDSSSNSRLISSVESNLSVECSANRQTDDWLTNKAAFKHLSSGVVAFCCLYFLLSRWHPVVGKITKNGAYKASVKLGSGYVENKIKVIDFHISLGCHKRSLSKCIFWKKYSSWRIGFLWWLRKFNDSHIFMAY